MVTQLGAERALDDGLLEPADGGVELLRRQRPLAHKLIENLGREWAPAAPQACAASVCGA